MVERLDRTQPPPGFDIAHLNEGGRDVFRYTRNLVGPAGIGLLGAAFGEPCERREQAIHLAWNRHELEDDPPGMCTEPIHLDRSERWKFRCEGRFYPTEDYWLFRDGARSSAWAWYWRRIGLAVALEKFPSHPAGSRFLARVDDCWPRCLTWTDKECEQAQDWLVWHTTTGIKVACAPRLPEVLRV